MTPAEPRLSQEAVAQLGQDIYERRVKALLTPADDGKHVVIDVATEEFEIDYNEWNAVQRLTDRRRGRQLFIVRIGGPYRMSFRMRYGRIIDDEPNNLTPKP